MSIKLNISEYEEVDDLIKQVRGNRSSQYDDNLEVHASSNALLQRMASCEKYDRQLNRLKKPAIHKIKLLPVVISQLTNKNMQNQLLDSLVLQRLRDWLRPLPDGSLPTSELRSEIYRLLEQLPIDSDHLQESEGLGMELMRLWRSPLETSTNRRRLRRLLERWMRAILQNDADYRQLGTEETANPKRSAEVRKRREHNQLVLEKTRVKKSSLPSEAWFDFVPTKNSRENDPGEVDKQTGNVVQKRVDEKLSNLARKRK